MKPDPGSFRDRNNRIYTAGDRIIRGLSDVALQNWNQVVEEDFYKSLVNQGKVIHSNVVHQTDFELTSEEHSWSGYLEHERVPFISYPYEWTFGMLKEAALLHLDILQKSLDSGWILKDATAYNIQWMGSRPTFIDTTSFEPYVEDSPWLGYRQFCMMFVYPLMLASYRKIDYLPLLRSNLEGIEPVEVAKYFSKRDLLRKGVFTHVYLHSRLQQTYSSQNSKNEKAVMKRVRHTKGTLLEIIKGLQRVISSLDLKETRSTWSHYQDQHSYDESSFEQKKEFVTRHVQASKWGQIWDIGCNTGTFSKLCSSYSNTVLALDADRFAIERFYQELKGSNDFKNILPLVMDLSNVSPNQGWRGAERGALETRGQPDLVIALALIHHIVISANVPLREFVCWLRSLNATVILEFVEREDEMTQQLLKNKVDQYSDYTKAGFETTVREYFTIHDSIQLKEGARSVYCLKPNN